MKTAAKPFDERKKSATFRIPRAKEKTCDLLRTVSCAKCGHAWLPRTQNPAECPRCKSRNWK